MAGPGGRPADVRLDDLEAPRFSPDAQVMLDGLAEYGAGLALDPDVLCAIAVERTGLEHWGAETGFRERLGVLCDALLATGAPPRGQAVTWEQLVGMLSNRLLIEDLVARHPEIEVVPVDAPIIIAGLPRTGTTHLHNLLSADPALRFLPYWESLEPVPSPVDQRRIDDGELEGGGEGDGRLASCQAGLDFMGVAMPLFERMHEMTLWHAHEEIQLLAADIAGMLFDTTDVLPAWRDHYRAEDQTPLYARMRRVLQVLTWLRPGEGGVEGTRWVLKSPQHLEQLGPLLATFPDATVVCTHRDPVAVTTSMVTMIAYSHRMRSDHPDVPKISEYWADRIGLLLDGVTADRHLVPEAQSIDVRFDDFMADEAGTVAAIYELADQPLDARAEHAMAQYVQEHPRGRHGGITYDLAQLGLRADAIADRNATYAERFAV